MISTTADYRVLVKDYSASLKRIAKDPQVERDITYYKTNIGKVKNADDLLKDYRLYSYAMRAYGLDEMIYAKAFMKKVLESDLSDANSFANKLTDARYRKFASAFDFTTGIKIAQTSTQEKSTVDLYSNSLTNEHNKVVEDTAYYNYAIDRVTKLDEFLLDSALRTYALKSFALDPATSYDHLKKLLTSDLSDPNSYANQLPEQIQTGVDTEGQPVYAPYPKITYLQFAMQFNFQSDGSLPEGVKAQSSEQKKSITDKYNLRVPSYVTPSAMALNVDYLKTKMATVLKVSDITNDPYLFGIVRTALKLPDDFLAATFENIVNSDLTDPNNYAKYMGGAAYVEIAKLFNFDKNSQVIAGKTAQSDAQLQSLIDGYKSNYTNRDRELQAKEDTYYQTKIDRVKTVNELLKDERLYVYVLKAYGFDPSEVSPYTIKQALTTDRSKRWNFVDANTDLRFQKLADAFNFDTTGKIATPKLAQDPSETRQFVSEYIRAKTRTLPDDQMAVAREKAKEETNYFTTAIEKVNTVSDLLADKKLVDVMLTAKGIDTTKVTASYLKRIFASDLDNPSSFANTEKDTRFRDLAASFNFDSSGKISGAKATGIQSRVDLLVTNTNFLQQSLELQAGEDNEGVRLALYFRRMAPGLNNAYDILADPALAEVFRTAFGYPASMAQVDVSRQVALINSKINLKDFQDPTKLEHFLARFTAMYDVSQEDNSASSVLALLR